MLLDKKLQGINHLQVSIDDFIKKGWSVRIKETNSLLESLTNQKLQYVETQTNIQKKLDFINKYNANQEVIFILLLIPHMRLVFTLYSWKCYLLC